MVEADSPAPDPKNSANAGAKSPVDSPCRYSSSQHLGDLRRAAHPAGQDRADVLHSLTGGRVGAPVIHPRAADLDRPGAHRQGPGWGVAVADHQPPAALVDLVGVGGQVGVHLRFQGLGQHPAGALAGQLVQVQAQLGLGLLVGDYTQHAAFLPRRRWPAGVLRSHHGWKVRRVLMLGSIHKIQV
jgi:hypothetical protein